MSFILLKSARSLDLQSLHRSAIGSSVSADERRATQIERGLPRSWVAGSSSRRSQHCWTAVVANLPNLRQDRVASSRFDQCGSV